MKNKTIIITGPTATGKTSLATDLCRKFNGEIISADSRQVYRGLDIGTGKDLDDYNGSSPVIYHGIDIRDPDEEFSLFEWRKEYVLSHAKISQKGKLPFICGGTPLYLDMLLNDYSLDGEKRGDSIGLEQLSLEELVSKLKKEHPAIVSSTDLTQKRRVLRAFEIAEANKRDIEPLPETDYLMLAPYWHRKIVHQRIEKRLKERWEGLKKEAQGLIDSGVSHERLDWFGLEYRYMSRYILKSISEKEAFEQLLIKIRQFAKRQDIWFRKMENKGHVIHWLHEDDKLSQAEVLIELFMNGRGLPKPEIRIADITYGPRTQ